MTPTSQKISLIRLWDIERKGDEQHVATEAEARELLDALARLDATPEPAGDEIELAACAIYEAKWPGRVYAALSDEKKDDFRRYARAAIRAIRPQRMSRDFNPEAPAYAPDDRAKVNLRGREWFVSMFDGPRGQRWYLDRDEEIAELAEAIRPRDDRAVAMAREIRDALAPVEHAWLDDVQLKARALVALLEQAGGGK